MGEMFEEKEIITEAVNALYAICEGIERGGYLLNAQVADVTGCEPHTGIWKQVIKKLRRQILDERGITLWPEKGVGLRFLTALETVQTVVPRARRRRALRQVRFGLESVNAVPSRELTAHQRRVRAMQVETLTKAKRDILDNMAQESVFLKKTAALPRPKVAGATE